MLKAEITTDPNDFKGLASILGVKPDGEEEEKKEEENKNDSEDK